MASFSGELGGLEFLRLSWLLLWFMLGFSGSGSISESDVVNNCSLCSPVRKLDLCSSLNNCSISDTLDEADENLLLGLELLLLLLS